MRIVGQFATYGKRDSRGWPVDIPRGSGAGRTQQHARAPSPAPARARRGRPCRRSRCASSAGLLLVVGADDRLDRRVERARGLDHLAHVDGVGRGDHQHRRARAICAWISTAGSAASPETAGMPLRAQAPRRARGSVRRRRTGCPRARKRLGDDADRRDRSRRAPPGRSSRRCVGAHRQLGQRVVALLQKRARRELRAHPVLQRLDATRTAAG